MAFTSLLAGGCLDGGQRREHAFLHVVLEALLGELLVGIDPGDHEHGVALATAQRTKLFCGRRSRM